MNNWFNTLNESLSSEDLVRLWPLGVNINYNENVSVSSDGIFISIYRDERGFYERPIYYPTKLQNGYVERFKI